MGTGKSCVSFWVESLEIDETGEREMSSSYIQSLFGGGFICPPLFFSPFPPAIAVIVFSLI